MKFYNDDREDGDTQKLRTKRALDVVASKTLQNSKKDNPSFTVSIKFVASEANAHYSTLLDNNFHYKMNRLAGVKYLENKGKLTIKSHTYLKNRDKLNRIQKILDNPKDHIFQDGGVSPD